MCTYICLYIHTDMCKLGLNNGGLDLISGVGFCKFIVYPCCLPVMVHTHMCIHIRMYTYVHVYACIYTHVHIPIYTCMYISLDLMTGDWIQW